MKDILLYAYTPDADGRRQLRLHSSFLPTDPGSYYLVGSWTGKLALWDCLIEACRLCEDEDFAFPTNVNNFTS